MDLVKRGCDFSARGSSTQPDPRERAEAVQREWQLIWTRLEKRGLRLHTSLLLRQVEKWGVPVRGRGRGGAGEGTCLCSAPPSSPQYLADAAEGAAWLRERRQELETAFCGEDQAAAETMLLRHQRLERAVRSFAAELSRLDEQARAAAARASLRVRAKTGKGLRLVRFQDQMCSFCSAPKSHIPPPVGHRGRQMEGLCGPGPGILSFPWAWAWACPSILRQVAC